MLPRYVCAERFEVQVEITVCANFIPDFASRSNLRHSIYHGVNVTFIVLTQLSQIRHSPALHLFFWLYLLMLSAAGSDCTSWDSEDFQALDEDGQQHHRGRGDAVWADCAGNSRPRPRPKPVMSN